MGLAAILFAILGITTLYAQVPQLISYQGRFSCATLRIQQAELLLVPH